MIRRAAVIAALLLASGVAEAQGDAPGGGAGGTVSSERVDQFLGGTGSTPDTEGAAGATADAPDGRPEAPRPDVTEPATAAAYNAAIRRHYDYQGTQLDHRLAVLRWQHLSSQIIFFVVIFVVVLGLYFSWIQFHRTPEDADPQITTIEASHTGFKISSPVLGVVILALSLGFFYLYLAHVYPITEI
ncbi:hypothetical protein [uncultured Jannaschia sp.]|uniref:hypothetical protein n=1 Tax=uncultured Jannaschia sp. TaxID=293347 RepID=UPI0026146A46|nr:hypothetical protein [uncultured Jannaschia sp.]